MTKFVLHGGYTRIDCQSNKYFFKEILKGFENPKVLMVYFAREKEKWNERFENDKKKLGKCEPSIANEKDFEKQIKESDIIFLSGGDTLLLLGKLKKVDFKELIKERVVVGSSAGVYVLVKNFYNNDRDKLEEGLGILNKKALCHYSKEREQRLEELRKRGEDLEIIILKDCEFVVLEEDF